MACYRAGQGGIEFHLSASLQGEMCLQRDGRFFFSGILKTKQWHCCLQPVVLKIWWNIGSRTLQCSFRFKRGGETVGAAASLRLRDKDSLIR